MALKEPILPSNTPLVVGQLYTIDGTQAVIKNTLTGTIATLSASLPGSPAIRACDVASRLGGVGRDIFEG